MPPVQQRYFASPVSFTWKHSAVKQLPRLWTVTKGPGCPCMLSLPGDGRDADRAEDGRGLRGRWRAIINVDRQVASRASADARVHVILGGTCAAISAWGLGFSRPGCSSTWGGGVQEQPWRISLSVGSRNRSRGRERGSRAAHPPRQRLLSAVCRGVPRRYEKAGEVTGHAA